MAPSWMMLISVNGDTILTSCSNTLVIPLSLTLGAQPDNMTYSSSLRIQLLLTTSTDTSQSKAPASHIWNIASSQLSLLSYPHDPSTDDSDNVTSLFSPFQWLTANLHKIVSYNSLWSGLCLLLRSHFLPCSLMSLEPHWPCFLGHTPSTILPQDLCICHFLCLKYSSH